MEEEEKKGQEVPGRMDKSWRGNSFVGLCPEEVPPHIGKIIIQGRILAQALFEVPGKF